MENSGWIKLHRSIQESWIWKEKPFDKKSAWVDLILLVNHKDAKVQFNGSWIDIKRGQHITSTVKLSEKWGWCRSSVDRFLKLLEKDGMIIRDSNKYRTLITIVKYDDFQSRGASDVASGEQVIEQPIKQVDKQRLGTNKNVKNYKNEKNKKEEPTAFSSHEDLKDETFDGVDYGWED